MNTTFNIKRILIQYVQKQRFEFQSVFSCKQAIDELINTIQQIQMLTKGGMDAKKIMHVITNVNDELIKDQLLDNEQLRVIQNQIKKFEYQKQINAYTMVYNLISTLEGKGVNNV